MEKLSNRKKKDHLSKGSRVEKDMARLGDVRCVQVVVVLDLLQVVVLQGHQEAEQGGGRDLEGAQKVSLLQDPEQKVRGSRLQEKGELPEGGAGEHPRVSDHIVS